MSIKHTIRSEKCGGMTAEVTTTPIKAIRLFCRECMGYKIDEIEKCTAPLCPLFPYRMGDSHAHSENTKNAMRERAVVHGFGKAGLVK